MSRPGPLSGRTALVTAGSRGIGRATALALARYGADVALSYHLDAESGESCAEEILRYYKQPSEAIQIDVPRDLVLVTDKTALETVIKNLLDNAVKYSTDLAHPVDVKVKAHIDGGRVRIRIRDQGVGIPRQHQRRIFERFYRTPHESVRARRGTGLGLFVVSALVRVLGGKVQVYSEGIGAGTSVRVDVPMKEAEIWQDQGHEHAVREDPVARRRG